MTSDAAIEIDNLCKSYGDGLVVDGFELRAERGEFVTLLGPSGSGKTSVLMMVAGFTTPTSGDIRVDGRGVLELPPHKRDMGVVFQNYALFPHRSVAENVAFPLRMRKLPKHEIGERVNRMLDLVGLAGMGERNCKQLSGGQQQRVALARALVFEPPVLLMDEPLAALDAKLREQLQVEIKQVQRRLGVTVLFVTHDQSEALSMSHRIAVLHNGRLVQHGTPSEIYQHPASVFAAQFLGEANLIDARVTGTDEMTTEAGMRMRVALSGQNRSEGTVVLRPERLRVDPAERPLDTVVSGTVADAVYVGHSTRLSVDVLGHRLTAYVPATDGRLPPEPGGRVSLGWNATDAVVVDRDTAGGTPANPDPSMGGSYASIG